MRSKACRWVVLVLVVGLPACSTAPRKDLGLERVLASIEKLRGEQRVREYALVELRAAEQAARALRQSTETKDEPRAHLAYMAERRIDLARARAAERFERAHLIELERDRDRILLNASLQEAERARAETEELRRQTMQRSEEAERARIEARLATERSERAEQEKTLAQEEAQQARRLALAEAREADLARQEADLATATADSLRRQLENLQARETNRGLVFTLGDVLFEYGQAALRIEALANLDQLVSFIEEYPERTVSIEGHTDSRGSESFNLKLSRARAESVREALIERGVEGDRIQAVGLGEEFPVASNESDFGRQQNRRVEIVILNEDA